MRATRAIRTSMVAAGLMLVSAMLGGCAATQTLLAKKDLVVQSKTSTAVFVEPVARPKRTIYLDVKSGVEAFDRRAFKQFVAQQFTTNDDGYRIVDDPDTAQFTMVAYVRNLEETNPTAAEKALEEGYKSQAVIAGGVTGAIAGGSLASTAGGAVLGGVAEHVTGYWVKDVTFLLVCDVQNPRARRRRRGRPQGHRHQRPRLRRRLHPATGLRGDLPQGVPHADRDHRQQGEPQPRRRAAGDVPQDRVRDVRVLLVGTSGARGSKAGAAGPASATSTSYAPRNRRQPRYTPVHADARGAEPAPAAARLRSLRPRPCPGRGRAARRCCVGGGASGRVRPEDREPRGHRLGVPGQRKPAPAAHPRPLREPHRRGRVPPRLARADAALGVERRALGPLAGAARRRTRRPRRPHDPRLAGGGGPRLPHLHDLLRLPRAAAPARSAGGMGTAHRLHQLRSPRAAGEPEALACSSAWG